MRDLTRDQVLRRGLAKLRDEQDVPASFPDEVVAEATESAAAFRPDGRRDLSHLGFATLDPASSTDLDQAFAMATDGDAVLLHYAIADVNAFVAPGSRCDAEAWKRGLTFYLPDGKAGLYPPVLAENAASLLPDGPRPAVVMTVAVDPAGETTLRSAERAMIHSRAKLAYDAVTAADLPPELPELARRIRDAEDRRGASRLEFPEQEIVDVDGGYALAIRPRLASEDDNATMSLAANLAVAAAMQAAGTGLFRVMDAPDERDVKGLRHIAHVMGLNWQRSIPLEQFARTLSTEDPRAAAFLLSIRRASGGARYAPFIPGRTPFHAAMAATYAHATAPLRRLADRYVLAAICALTEGSAIPGFVTDAFAKLPDLMDAAEARSSKVERDVIDLVEAVTLMGHEGSVFEAMVIDVDAHGAKIQLADPAIIARVQAQHADPGDRLRVRLETADPARRLVSFTVA